MTRPNLMIVLILIAITVIGLGAVLFVMIAAPERKDALFVTVILSTLSPTMTGLITIIKITDLELSNGRILHDLDGRLSQFIDEARAVGELRGRASEREERRERDDAREHRAEALRQMTEGGE